MCKICICVFMSNVNLYLQKSRFLSCGAIIIKQKKSVKHFIFMTISSSHQIILV